ncbi:CPBP family intramembrane metalloprotease [Actinospica durhamensis]|uniref:CPBP family intramembrane metalloprotease n=1 Tax=Actinospica durhamensis TaxID=1508375 RepID=A0A941EJ27_9ACTN|nr:CPBP family intramembrane glutamic endopeptidase [Actinospica durhamensis]MBR7832306.1 CPBP family intramembrane metalloprotease [Actinospica durhamensis]
MEIEDRIPEGVGAPAAAATRQPQRIGLPRALGEILAVYVPSFGLGVFTALVLLANPSLGNNDEITGWLPALEEILQYVMQASVTIFGVAFFCSQRGVTLPMLFGKLKRPPEQAPPAGGWYGGYGYSPYGYPGQVPQPLPEGGPQQPPTGQWGAWGQWTQQGQAGPPQQPSAPQQAPQWGEPEQTAPIPAPAPTAPLSAGPPAPAAPGVPAWGAPPQQHPVPTAYGFGGGDPAPFAGVPQPPQERSRGWQFTRAYFVSMAGVLGFLISVIIYSNVTNQTTGAPDQGSSPWLVLVGLFVALAAGFGEEMLITGLVTNALEKAGMTGNRAWVIYLVAICLRIPFHLYYGWASLGVIIFTMVNIWVYRRWRLLWPIILAHATYDFFEYLGSVVPTAAGGLLILALAFGTLVMVVVIVSVENSDRVARRRYARFTEEQALVQNAAAA